MLAFAPIVPEEFAEMRSAYDHLRAVVIALRTGLTTADDVVDRAEQLVDREGVGALSVRRLASELAVSRQIVYTHFTGMHDVLEQLHLRSGRYAGSGPRVLVGGPRTRYARTGGPCDATRNR